MALNMLSRQPATLKAGARRAMAPVRPASRMVRARSASSDPMVDKATSIKMMREGVKEFGEESVLTPRFYTTDFEEMERLFSMELNPNLNMEEFEAMLAEFKLDYNQRHFVRNESFKVAADKIDGATRKIFVEFLERSCTAEFSGFLLYKELGRRLKPINPVVAEIFTLMSRDEARHAGFLNKAMSDFNLALDLGFLTKNRKYTFFKPKFIVYATYLSEKIGYWRYISIYRHLQRNPDNQMYPLFEYFENWCQDENRHGDFFTAILKSQPQFINDVPSRLWSRFFCMTVYITMYLNDHQRNTFYESLGLEVKGFNQHVIIETNKTTARIFPEVPDCEHPDYFKRMDRMVELNTKLLSIGRMDLPGPLKKIMQLPVLERMVAEVAQIFFMPTLRCGSVDCEPELKAQVMY
eukprot:CAMPEP_0119104754 /NCGR_PEP_ID=MMETSP1180-20130426/2878_1 /TAXON_ID=3052 ORGANISM="Chlamydomonas cf sp, Strain CCMP681" /NCGR_SAMPLE_ID=MMETSP1180 /ASSEMBLY_ACC=CAM_ASM_000741 /LENGTH=408 /DNA_ID=CAMNT_0007089589 /DNA_START=98 /DNA_END=1324 /DNA_ORIENTATION=+